jgi:HEAT repeat protein
MMATIEEQRLKKWLQVLDEPDAEMSKIAADKLGELGMKEAVPALIKAMQGRTMFVAMASAQALGTIGDEQAIPALIKTLQRHQEVNVRTAAAESLGNLRARQGIPALKKVINDYLEKNENDRFRLTRGYERGLFTTAIASLKQMGVRDAKHFAEKAESASK